MIGRYCTYIDNSNICITENSQWLYLTVYKASSQDCRCLPNQAWTIENTNINLNQQQLTNVSKPKMFIDVNQWNILIFMSQNLLWDNRILLRHRWTLLISYKGEPRNELSYQQVIPGINHSVFSCKQAQPTIERQLKGSKYKSINSLWN